MNTAAKQNGIALVVGMVVLLALTMIGVAAMKTTALEERMAGNNIDRNHGFHAAESALREAEEFLASGILPPFDGTGGLYEPTNWSAAPVWTTSTFTDANSRRYSGALNGATAHYIIEKLPTATGTSGSLSLATDVAVEDAGFYRVSALGRGPSGLSQVLLQTVYER